jgi:hypothetical protein
MLSDEARELRRCKATTKAGQPCPNYSVWEYSDLGLCSSHLYSRHREPGKGKKMLPGARYLLCTCKKGPPHPHRPNSGKCAWPYDLDRPYEGLVKRKKLPRTSTEG